MTKIIALLLFLTKSRSFLNNIWRLSKSNALSGSSNSIIGVSCIKTLAKLTNCFCPSLKIA